MRAPGNNPDKVSRMVRRTMFIETMNGSGSFVVKCPYSKETQTHDKIGSTVLQPAAAIGSYIPGIS